MSPAKTNPCAKLTGRTYPEGDWRKMFSQAAGFYLKLKEQVNVNRLMIIIISSIFLCFRQWKLLEEE